MRQAWGVFLGSEHGVGRASGGTAELLRRDPTNDAVDAGFREERFGEVCPRAVAVGRDVVDAEREIDDVSRHRGEMRRVRWRRALVVHDGNLVPFLAESQRKFEKAWLSTLERGVAAGVFRSDLDVRLTYRFVRDTVWVAASWYRPGGQHSPEEIARQYLSMVLDGIAVRT